VAALTSSLEPIVVLSLVVSAIAALIFAGVLGALLVFTVRYRDPRPGPVPQIHGHRQLELAWTAAPLTLLAVIFAFQPRHARRGRAALRVQGLFRLSPDRGSRRAARPGPQQRRNAPVAR